MATRQIERRVLWFCTRCGRSGSKHIETTQSAEEHADETGHPVLATGIVVYLVGQSQISEDDPFRSKTSANATMPATEAPSHD